MERNFADNNNKVSNTVADTWTQFGEGGCGTLDFQGVWWDGSSGQDLKIRDAFDNEIYHAVSDGTAVVDLLASPLTVRLPLKYLTDEADTEIIVHGKIVS